MPCATDYQQAMFALAGRRSSPMNLPPRTGPVPPQGPFPPGPADCGVPQYYPPGCSPCPPSPEAQALAAAAYQLQCQNEGYQVRRAARAEILGNQPQIPLGAGNAFLPLNPNVPTTYTATATVPMCITRTVVPSLIAPFFLITSIKVQRVELLADSIGIPAETFRPDAINIPLIEFPELYAGTPITITVNNFDAAPHPFMINWWGVQTSQPTPCLG